MTSKNIRLKYFYLIDTEPIMEHIKTLSEYKDKDSQDAENILSLFHSIFSEITKVSQPYSAYILSASGKSRKSFFNEDGHNKQIDNIFLLCGISLFHHCILHGFKNTLEIKKPHQSSSPNNKILADSKKDLYFNSNTTLQLLKIVPLLLNQLF